MSAEGEAEHAPVSDHTTKLSQRQFYILDSFESPSAGHNVKRSRFERQPFEPPVNLAIIRINAELQHRLGGIEKCNLRWRHTLRNQGTSKRASATADIEQVRIGGHKNSDHPLKRSLRLAAGKSEPATVEFVLICSDPVVGPGEIMIERCRYHLVHLAIVLGLGDALRRKLSSSDKPARREQPGYCEFCNSEIEAPCRDHQAVSRQA